VDGLFASAARFAGGGGGGAPPPRPPPAGGGDDSDLAAAIAASLGGGVGGRGSAPAGAGEDDPDLAAAIAASLADAEPGERGFGGGGGSGAPAGAGPPAFGGAGRRLGGSDAPAAAPPAPVPASSAPLPEEPPAGAPGTLTIAARLPDGSRAARRFAGGADTPAGVGAWIASLLPGGAASLAAHRLVSPPVPGCPALEMDVGSSGQTLAEAGVASGVMFNVVRR